MKTAKLHDLHACRACPCYKELAQLEAPLPSATRSLFPIASPTTKTSTGNLRKRQQYLHTTLLPLSALATAALNTRSHAMSDIDPEDIPSLSTTAPSSWRYTAEGGANLVLSYVGPPSTFSGKLLRLRKKKRVVGSGGAIPEDVGIVFGEQVIKPLLGEEQVVRMEKVEIVTDWLKGIKRMLHESGVRPKERADEDEIDEERGVVVLAEDLIHGEGVLAIEIKVRSATRPVNVFQCS